MSDRDYYEILGLTPRADGQMVDQAYWHLVRKYQSLAATNAHAQYMIDELNEAYGVLGNPKLREQYDAFRDDVLIRAGMIKPVRSKPTKQPKAEQPAQVPKKAKERKQRKERSLPSLPVPQHWRTYTVSALIALLAFAAAWQGVNIVLVVIALAVGLGLSLTPTISKRVSEFEFTFEIPSLQMPEVKAPKLEIPKVAELAPSMLRDLGASQKDEGIDADTLSASTRDTIARWRRSVGLRVAQPEDAEEREPLVLMSEPEQKTDGDGDPFGAVMDILRSGARVAPEKKIG
jgi:hypothetical protein